MSPQIPRGRRPACWLAALTLLGLAAGADPPPAAKNAAKPAPPPAAVARPKADPPPPTAPMVVSKAKERDVRKGSGFLRPPGSGSGSDRYAEDWAEVPPWRQATFFGVRARGQFFVYVVDCSGSMIDEDRLARAKEEVRRSIARLQEPQRFLVIFYNDRPIPMPGAEPRVAGLTARSQLLAWLGLIEPDGETDPRGALGMALSLRPDAVFLLSDGEFPDGTAEAVAKRNPRKVPVHGIDLGNGSGGDQLRRIAAESGGLYVLRPWTGGP